MQRSRPGVVVPVLRPASRSVGSRRGLLLAGLIACGCLPACFPEADALVPATPEGRPDGGDDGNLSPADGAAPHDGVVIPDVAGVSCADFAAVFCARERECKPRTFEDRFGTPEACVPAEMATCNRNYAEFADSNWNLAAYRKCIGSMAGISCEDWRATTDDLKGLECLVGGNRPAGSGCGAGAQCQGARCYRFGEAGYCGRCKARSLKDGACDTQIDCVPGLLCASRKCKTPGPLGSPCDAENPCHPVLRCDAGKCVALGGLDAPCMDSTQCEQESFLVCNTAVHRCVRARPASTWNETRPDGTVDYCAGGAFPATTGACIPRVKDGEPCVVMGDGPRCAAPSICRVPSGEVYGNCVSPVLPACPTVRPPPPPGGYPPGEDPWCPGTLLPVFCPEMDTLRDNCWTKGTVCSTRVDCNGVAHSCSSETSVYDCQLRRCGPQCTGRPTATACDRCTQGKCCGVSQICDLDAVCRDGKSGGNWTALQACLTTYCGKDCMP
jgi:hypothetical protein